MQKSAPESTLAILATLAALDVPATPFTKYDN